MSEESKCPDCAVCGYELDLIEAQPGYWLSCQNGDCPLNKVYPTSEDALNSWKQEWHPISEAPMDGTAFYARFQTPMRWLPYKPAARKQGYPAGRWQEMNEYGGWDNSKHEPIEWKPHPGDVK